MLKSSERVVPIVIRETGVMIKDILKMKPLENCKVIAGENGVNRVVTKVNIMADPDILNWVGAGEFLLTTAYFFKTTTLEEQINMIKESNSRNLSGLGIKIFPYVECLPDEVIELANRINFPIIEIHYEIPLTDIMTPVFQEIFDRQSNALRKVESLHKDTMNTVLKGGTIKDIISCVEKNVKNPIIIKDHHFEEKYVHVDSEDKEIYDFMEEDLDKLFKNSNFTKYNKTVVDKVKCNFMASNSYDEVYIDRVMVPIVVKNNIHGHIAVYGFKEELTNFDSLYLESTSNIIALELLKKISVQEVENKYRAEFFEDLISLDEKRKAKALERAGQYRFDKDAVFNIMSIKLVKPGDDDEELSQAMTKIIYTIETTCREESRTFLIANKSRYVSVLFMWKTQEECKKNIRRITELIKEGVDKKLSSGGFKIGIGRSYRGLENTNKSLKDAEKAIDASKTYVDAQVIDFDSLGIYKIFCQDHLKDELIDFYRSTLEALVMYDRKKETELVKTLIIYYETNGNLKKMSEMLFTHYNTVLYRINRIQDITSKSLEDERDRYGLQTALKIMQILDL
jgi:PucR family transcriptional regulator, purine catabolism regulatory protein